MKQVMCIDVRKNPFVPTMKELQESRIYTVLEEDPVYYHLAEGGWWRKDRFKEVKL